jgi:hypothetical protein
MSKLSATGYLSLNNFVVVDERRTIVARMGDCGLKQHWRDLLLKHEHRRVNVRQADGMIMAISHGYPPSA